MKKFAVILTLSFISLGLMSFGRPAHALYPTELVKNGGFELGDNGDWSGSVTSKSAIVDGGVAAHTGTHGLQIQGDCFPGPCPRIISLQQDVLLPADATGLQISLWYLNHLSLQFSIKVVDATNPSDQWIASTIPNSSGWATLSADLMAHRGGTARVIIRGEEWTPAFYTYVDDVSIIAQYDDTTAPTTTLQSTPVMPNGANGYFTTVPSIMLTGTDDAQGSGVATTFYHWDSGADAVYTGALSPVQGTHTLTFYSVDISGNVESPHTVTFKIDSVQPLVNAAVLKSVDGSNGWYKTLPSVSLAASDAVSGVAQIQYRWNNGLATPSTGAVTAPEGVNVLHFWATDHAGNIGQEGTLTMKVDTGDPTLALVGGVTPVTVNTASALISGTVSDGGSGVASVTINGVAVSLASGGRFEKNMNLVKGSNVFTIVATDFAGRTKVATRSLTYQATTVLGATTKAPFLRIIRKNVQAATVNTTVLQKFTLAGSNFSKRTKVWIGKVRATQTVYKNSATIVVVVRLSRLPAGTYNVTLQNSDGQVTTLKKGLKITRA